MTKRDSTPIRRVTSIPNSATADSEAPWQQLMVFNYVVFEVMEAMSREQATDPHAPLNHSWQQFMAQLRLQKPELCVYLETWFQQELPDEQGGMQ